MVAMGRGGGRIEEEKNRLVSTEAPYVKGFDEKESEGSDYLARL